MHNFWPFCCWSCFCTRFTDLVISSDCNVCPKNIGLIACKGKPSNQKFDHHCRGHFFNFETRMRISPIQSRTLRRDKNFLTFDLRLPDEIEKNSFSISVIETRSRFIIFILKLQNENENLFDLISVFETKMRVLSC